MRVTFLGKGGSGKTTMATSFIKYLNKSNKKVLAIDADINVHLADALNMDTKFLGDSFEEISNYFEHKRILQGKAIIGSTPPCYDSKFIKPTFDDVFFKCLATFKENIAMLTIGSYTDKKVGFACYHSKLGNAVLIYNRLLDDKHLFVVTDATAGIDSVGTSMFCVSDVNIFVVEPTKKSVEVYKDFKKVIKDFKIKTMVIANKIVDEDDINFIKSEIDEKDILGFVKESKLLKRYEQGDVSNLDTFVDENEEINKKLLDLLENTDKDWDNYYSMIKKIYVNDAKDWYSQYYGQDLPSFLDSNFSYKEIIKK
ncbi:MAG: AAA family ATPase [Clostridia bacterium]